MESVIDDRGLVARVPDMRQPAEADANPAPRANPPPVTARRAKPRTVLELDAPALEALERLRSATGAKATVAVVKSALRLYDFLSQKRAEGWSIQLVKGDEAKELVVL